MVINSMPNLLPCGVWLQFLIPAPLLCRPAIVVGLVCKVCKGLGFRVFSQIWLLTIHERFLYEKISSISSKFQLKVMFLTPWTKEALIYNHGSQKSKQLVSNNLVVVHKTWIGRLSGTWNKPLVLPWRFLGLINVVFKKKSIEPDLIYDHGY